MLLTTLKKNEDKIIMSERCIIVPPGDKGALQEYETEIAAAYKVAFAGEPWFEKTRCVDEQRRCAGGFSALSLGEMCGTCGGETNEEAYDTPELIDRWRAIASDRPAAWYLELVDEKVALAGLFWRATPELLAQEKYPDVPAMSPWLQDRYEASPFIWLDEMFANKNVRASANLLRFGSTVETMRDIFGIDRLAYRTITPQMKQAALRLGTTPLRASVEVPDRRDFIDIRGVK